MTTLRDALPYDWDIGRMGNDARVRSMLDVEVIEEVDGCVRGQGWPGRHVNVYWWYRLANGYAVGWNENPSVGWSFPLMRDPKGV